MVSIGGDILFKWCYMLLFGWLQQQIVLLYTNEHIESKSDLFTDLFSGVTNNRIM